MPNGALIQEESSFAIVDLLENLIHYRWHFVVTFVLVTSATLFYAIVATPIYVADTLIKVDSKMGGSFSAFTGPQSSNNALAAPQSSISTEIEIIKSRSIIGHVADELQENITVSVANRIPFIGGALSRVLPKGSDGLVKPLFGIDRWAWGGEQLKIHELSVPASMINQSFLLEVGQDEKWQLIDKAGNVLATDVDDALTVPMGGELRMKIESLSARPGTKFQINVRSLEDSVNSILGGLVVVEDRRQTTLIKLKYESASPAYAAKVLNAITDNYIAQNITRLSEEAERTLEFLNQELPRLRAKLGISEQALINFRSFSKTIDISNEIKELLSKVTVIDKMRFELELKRNEYARRYEPIHPLMQAIKIQSDGLNAETAKINNQISQLPSLQQDYLRLARDFEINNQLYMTLLANSQQLQITKAGITGTSVVIDKAVVPQYASKPHKALIVAIGALAGLVLGFVVCQILGLVLRKVRDPKKLEHAIHLPVLGILPLDSDQQQKTNSNDKSVYLLAKDNSSASFIEALRSLRTALIFKLSEKQRSKVVLITSAIPSQGKSFVAANLSYLMAAAGKKTLLIEADIRLPSVRRYIDYNIESPGLSTVLCDNKPVESVILKEVFPQMDFLPSGPVVRNPGDLMATDKLSQLIHELAELYDYVIIDAPPLLPVHDARSLSQSADVTLFIVRQEAVSVAEVLDAVDVFNKSGNRIDGIVFNGFVPSMTRYYGYGYGYGYGHRRYGLDHFYGKRKNHL